MATHSPRLFAGFVALALAVPVIPFANAATRQLLWTNGDPHPDFDNQRHGVDMVTGIMEDGTVIYKGSLSPDPPDGLHFVYGFYYVKPGQLPKPLGGLDQFQKVQQVLINSDNKIAVLTWDQAGPGAAATHIYVGTINSFGTEIFAPGSFSSPADLPVLNHFYTGNMLAFSSGERCYRSNASGVPTLIYGPETTTPNQPGTTTITGRGLVHMAKDGRALVGCAFYRQGFYVGNGLYLADLTGPLETLEINASNYPNPGGNYNLPPDPARPGYGMSVSNMTSNSAGKIGTYATSFKLSTGDDNHFLLGTRTLGNDPVVLEDPVTNGGDGFHWNDTGVPYHSQMDAAGDIMTHYTAVFDKAPAQRRVTAIYKGGKWVPLVTQGDSLAGLPAGVTVGFPQKKILENGGWFLFTGGLAGSGVADANDTALWAARRTTTGTSFDLVAREGSTLSLSGGVTKPLVMNTPADDSYEDADPGPDAGKRHTMTANGKFAQILYSGSYDTSGYYKISGLFVITPQLTTPKFPEIDVQQPAGSSLKDGSGKKSFGTVKVGMKGAAKKFIIKNLGTADLNALSISIDGNAKKDFTVGKPNKTTVPGGKDTSFNVTFEPTAAGTRDAVLHLKSNDANESPYDIKVTGMGAKK